MKKIKKIEDNTIKDIRNLVKLKKRNRWHHNLFNCKLQDYYKPVRVGNFWNNNYIEYERNGDTKNKTLPFDKYLNKFRPYLKDVINDLKNSNTWKVQYTVKINFVSSKDNDEERVMHSKNDSIKIIINDKAYEVIDEFFSLT